MIPSPAVLASIPSPSSGAIHIGSLQLRMYGLMIALAVIAAVWLAGRRLEEKGIGTRDQMASIALWAVPAGIIGARLYHVITDWQLFRDDPWKVVAIWEGGLGIWGGIGLGVAVGVWRAHKLGIPLLLGLDAVAPALPLAQAIGRLGNWWNQELFGRPTELPWGLEISPVNRPPGYEQYATFHPTFLYEALWNLALVAALLWIDKKGWLRPGRLILVYVAGYTFARFFIEGLRIDTANKVAGLRVNEWVSLVVFLIATGWLVVDVVRHRGDVRETAVPDGETGGDQVGESEAVEGAQDDEVNAQFSAAAAAGSAATSATDHPTPTDGSSSTGDSPANRPYTAPVDEGGPADEVEVVEPLDDGEPVEAVEPGDGEPVEAVEPGDEEPRDPVDRRAPGEA